MSLEKLHMRYAKAFYQLAQKQGAVVEAVRDADTLLASYTSVPAFQEVLHNPLLKPVHKRRILTKAFKASLHPLTQTFLTFLVSKRRGSHLQPILRQLKALYQAAQHIHTAYLTTVTPLSSALQKSIVAHIQKLTATQEPVVLLTQQDPALIGGYILKIHDTQLDMSIRTQLTRLRKHWSQAPLPELNTSTA